MAKFIQYMTKDSLYDGPFDSKSGWPAAGMGDVIVTENGKLKVYASEAKFTGEPIEEAYFGCGGVAEIANLQDKLLKLAKGGFKHHTTVGVGHMKNILLEAFTTYLGYDIIDID